MPTLTTYTPPRQYLYLIRHGAPMPEFDRSTPRPWKALSGGSRYLGTAGMEYQYDPGLALRLTQVLLQQGFTTSRIHREHMKRTNVGFLWVRRQEDPEAASADLIARCDRSRKPMIPMKHRHARILALLSTGEIVSQKQLIAHVGTARDSDTRGDLRSLEAAGAIEIVCETHGRVVWRRISLAVTASEFWEISKRIRRDLASGIRRKEHFKASAGKGCKRLTVSKAKFFSDSNIKDESSNLDEKRDSEAKRSSETQMELMYLLEDSDSGHNERKSGIESTAPDLSQSSNNLSLICQSYDLVSISEYSSDSESPLTLEKMLKIVEEIASDTF